MSKEIEENTSSPVGEEEGTLGMGERGEKERSQHNQVNEQEIKEPESTIQRTPKRKLSPTISTPLGKGRKRTTSIYNSPQLRQRLELVGDSHLSEQIHQGAPNLFEGIGRLRLRSVMDDPTLDHTVNTIGAGVAAIVDSGVNNNVMDDPTFESTVNTIGAGIAAIVNIGVNKNVDENGTSPTESTEQMKSNIKSLPPAEEATSNSSVGHTDDNTQTIVGANLPEMTDNGQTPVMIKSSILPLPRNSHTPIRTAMFNRYRRRVGSDTDTVRRRINRPRTNSLNLSEVCGRQRKITEIFKNQSEEMQGENTGDKNSPAPE